MKNILMILLVMSITTLFGCKDRVLKDGEKVCKIYFNAALSDPQSLEIYKQDESKTGKHSAVFKIDYGYKDNKGLHKRNTVEIETSILTEADGPEDDIDLTVNGEPTYIKFVKQRRRTDELLDIIKGN